MLIEKANNFYVEQIFRHDKVTGSNTLYLVHWPNNEELRFFVDAGAKQGELPLDSYNSFFPFDPSKFAFGIITHNHFDHVGLLPVFTRQGFDGPIYTSKNTALLVDISLKLYMISRCGKNIILFQMIP